MAQKRRTKAIYRTINYRRQRDVLVKAFRPGQRCCLCGHPITTVRYIEAQHQPGTERVIGLAHGARNRCPTCGLACNQTDGAARLKAQARARKSGVPMPPPKPHDPERWVLEALATLKPPTSPPLVMMPRGNPMQAAIPFSECDHCRVLHMKRGRFCSTQCSNAWWNEQRRPTSVHRLGVACADCGAAIRPRRWKCDDCARRAERERKRRGKARRRARGVAHDAA